MRGTVLVTGAAGALGTALMEKLAAENWKTRALVHRRPVPTARECVEGDLCDPASLERAVRHTHAVVHLAAETHARRTHDYERVNLAGTRQLVAAAVGEGVERFVFVSSRAAALDGGSYSRTKLLAEEAVRDSPLDYAIIRLPELLVAGGREGVNRIVAAARRGSPIPVVGSGNDEICPILLEDAVPPIVSATAGATRRKTYTLAGECLTVHEFARACIDHFGSSSRIIKTPTPIVAALSVAARFLPLPLYPDQLARLSAAKPAPSAEAEDEIGFRPRPLASILDALAQAP